MRPQLLPPNVLRHFYAGEPLECGGDAQNFRLGERIGAATTKRKPADAGRLRRMRDHHDGIGDHGIVRGIGAVPFQHGEFGQMQVAALPIAKHPRQLENPFLPGGQKLLAGKFG